MDAIANIRGRQRCGRTHLASQFPSCCHSPGLPNPSCYLSPDHFPTPCWRFFHYLHFFFFLIFLPHTPSCPSLPLPPLPRHLLPFPSNTTTTTPPPSLPFHYHHYHAPSFPSLPLPPLPRHLLPLFSRPSPPPFASSFLPSPTLLSKQPCAHIFLPPPASLPPFCQRSTCHCWLCPPSPAHAAMVSAAWSELIQT